MNINKVIIIIDLHLAEINDQTILALLAIKQNEKYAKKIIIYGPTNLDTQLINMFSSNMYPPLNMSRISFPNEFNLLPNYNND